MAMTVDQAWDHLRARGTQSRDHDLFPAAPYIAAFEQATDEPARKKLREAMWTLLSDGTFEDQAIAATFFSKVGIPDALADRAVRCSRCRG